MGALLRVRDNLSEYLAGRLGMGGLLAAMLLLGVVTGALAVRGLGSLERQELMDLLGGYMRTLADPGGAPPAGLLGRALLSHSKTLVIVWLLGITVLGLPGVLALAFTRGFVAGFAAAFLAGQSGWRGIVFSLAAMLPQNLLAWPALLMAGALSLSFGVRFAQAHWQRRPFPYYAELGNYSIAMLLPALGFVGAAVLEASLCPVLMALAARL